MEANWSTVKNGEVARHYVFDGDGFVQAQTHAEMYGYEVWQSFNGEPRYLMWQPRVKGE